MPLKQGIPLISSYQELTREELFLSMERFSDDFIGRFAPALSKYNWVADPFHQWSRQWEYPFVYSHLEEYVDNHPDGLINILDAGSGITFFPYYVASTFGDHVRLNSYDIDNSLPQMYREVNSEIENPVDFTPGDIHQLPFEDSHFSVIYCVSVIEHTPDYEPIIGEFHRVLKPGGLLLITFDISLDTDGPISPKKARSLVSLVERDFTPVAGFDSETDLNKPMEGYTDDILNTEWIKKTHPSKLPWQRHLTLREIVGNLIRLRIPRNFTKLTCFCEALVKEQI